MTYLLQHSAAIGLLAVTLVLPGFVLWPRSPSVDLRMRPLARIVLGVTFWVVFLFLASVISLLEPWLFVATSLFLAVALLAQRIRGFGNRGRRVSSEPRTRKAFGATTLLSAGLLTVALAPLFLLASSPTVSWDANAYHLTVPKLFVQHGGFREVPFNVYSYWPLNIQLLYAMALSLGDFVLAKLLHFAFGLATLLALYTGCRTFHREESGALAVWFFIANGVVIYELRVAYVDLAYAFFFVTGFLFMRAARDGNKTALWLAGLSCGLVAGIKITGIAGAALVAALYLPRLHQALRQGTFETTARSFLLRFVLPVLALWGPWLGRTAWLTGNPVYPFFHDIFGGQDWSSALTDQFQTWQSSIGMGRTLLDTLLLPLRVITSGGEGYQRFDGELGLFWLLVLPLACWAAWRVALARDCLSIAGLFFLYWSLTSQQMRFLIPALTLLAMAGGVAITELVRLIPVASRRRAATLSIIVATALAAAFHHGRVLAAGYRTLGVFLKAEGDLVSSAMHPIYRIVNETLPEEARLLFLNTNQVFFCDREAIADSFFEASQIADWLSRATDSEGIKSLLADRGVSHVLIENRHRGAIYPAALAAFLRDPTYARPLYRSEDGRFSLLQLR